ncbi:AAA family ATPase [Bisbaumannia pacifica]|uniref:AAA family ATPase n=1 Tax=Bisbaumannia pacifica TaxID=77098 RepID=A0ABD4KZP3_9GAMM|nr:AAA family ATPase [Halomonas pacifica]MBH8579518.1 AAA family ATPase [Halomonas pacifica]
MGVVLERLISCGINVPDALIEFSSPSCLIRGPSDTGKSYIRDCLWYLLGGDKIPKEIPESKGYDTLLLQFSDIVGQQYTIKRSLFGGDISLYSSTIEEVSNESLVAENLGDLFVRLSGAEGKQLLRSKSKKGGVTGGDLRHWSLISQPAMISEEPTSGAPTSQTQRKASFSLFLTGKDDSSFVLDPSKDEKVRIKALLESTEENIKRIQSEIPEENSRDEIEDAILKLNDALALLDEEQKVRSTELREVRGSLKEKNSSINKIISRLSQSEAMVSRLSLLDSKYSSDLERLLSVGDTVAIFDSLEVSPCLLCGTSIEEQVDRRFLDSKTIQSYRDAALAEARKIEKLREGLLHALEVEKEAVDDLKDQYRSISMDLECIENQEKYIVERSQHEVSENPSELAERKSDYLSQLRFFDELERLQNEHSRLLGLIPEKRSKPIKRHADSDSKSVGEMVLEILHQWGFKEIETASLESNECDVKIDGRPRLSYGAGKRGIFLSATIVALMQHAISRGYPHLGVVVLDSPIKSYSDPENISDVTTSPNVLRNSFYKWLANREEGGQVIVLENEPILQDTSSILNPIEFSGSLEEGRFGFYPSL